MCPLKLNTAIDLFLDSMVGLVSPATIDWYKKRLPDLVKVLGDRYIDQITIHDLRRWRVDLCTRDQRYINHPYRIKPIEGGLSKTTIHQYVRGSKRFFKWLHQEGLIKDNPAATFKLPPLPDYKPRGIKVSDRDNIINAVKSNPRDLAIVLFLADTGCRVGGVANLKLNDLDLVCQSAQVHEKGKGGYGKIRTVFYTDVTYAALITWLQIRPHCKCDYVFLHQKKPEGLLPSGIYQILKRAAKRAGVSSGYNPHSWRHGAIRAWLNEGMSLPEVSQLAGHSSVSITGDIYGIVSEKKLQEDHNKYSWLKAVAF